MPSPSPLSNHRHHHHILPLFLPSALLLSSKSAMGAEHRIKTPAEFTDFVNSVNTNGESYNGTTVYLDSDLSLSGVTDPIGKSNSKYFRGVFDGQGHTISNLNINSTTNYASLFGYSTGLTIRNVVLDESCSIVGSFIDSSGYTYVSGFIGHCTASAGSCAIENNVNMGSVTFDGTNDQLRLAGTVSTGPLTHSGTNNWCSNIGGIVGSLGDTKYYKYIQNCANYGAIMHSGRTSNVLRITGIVGYSNYSCIENCLSAGKISLSNEPPSIDKGSLIGCANPPTNISYCYFTNDVGISDLYSSEDGSPTIANTPNSTSTINSTLLSSLNTQATNNGWSKWALNTNKAEVSFKVNDCKGFSTSSQLLLLPDPTESDRRTFKGWFTDSSYSSPLTSYEVSGATTLYGLYVAKVVVTFNATGGVPSQQNLSVLPNYKYGDLPSAGEKTGHTFDGWFTEADGGMQVTSETTVTTANDHTLYAHWTPNRYTITFLFENEKPRSFTLNYNDSIPYPNDFPSKAFHKFKKWCVTNESSTEKCDLSFVPAQDLTFAAVFDLDSNLVAGTSVAIIVVVLAILLIIVVILLVVTVRSMKQRCAFVELDEFSEYGRDAELVEERILQQVEATNITNSMEEIVTEYLETVDKNKGVVEILTDLDVECDGSKGSDDVVESFRITTASAAIAKAVQDESNLIPFAAEFLALLYSTVREQEKYEEFGELYFGMKDIGDFMDKMDEETICFGGIVSGFTSRGRAIQSLVSKDEGNNTLSGVLFKVDNGRGYRIGNVDEKTEEVLFEFGSVFKVKSVVEVTKRKYFAVDLSFVSPNSENEMIVLK